jgi:hypothetical protein
MVKIGQLKMMKTMPAINTCIPGLQKSVLNRCMVLSFKYNYFLIIAYFLNTILMIRKMRDDVKQQSQGSGILIVPIARRQFEKEIFFSFDKKQPLL